MQPACIDPEDEQKEIEPVEETPEIVDLPKKTRRGKQPRSIEELENVPAEEMSDAETIKYIQHLREQVNFFQNQFQTMRDSFNGVQVQRNKAEQELQQFKTAAKTQLQFCKDTIAQAYKTLHYMQPLED